MSYCGRCGSTIPSCSCEVCEDCGRFMGACDCIGNAKDWGDFDLPEENERARQIEARASGIFRGKGTEP